MLGAFSQPVNTPSLQRRIYNRSIARVCVPATQGTVSTEHYLDPVVSRFGQPDERSRLVISSFSSPDAVAPLRSPTSRDHV